MPFIYFDISKNLSQYLAHRRKLLAKLMIILLIFGFLASLASLVWAKEESLSAKEARAKALSASLKQDHGEEKLSNYHLQVLSETAKAYGFQAGFSFQYSKFMREVEEKRAKFSQIFDFRRLLLNDMVLPPVIMATGQAMLVESPILAKEVEAQYKIVADARIISQPPTFADYLWAETQVLKPHKAVTPKTKAETSLWTKSFDAGFDAGIEHAYSVFEQAMDKLIADYRGILQFKLLAKRGLVSLPILASGEPTVQVGDKVLAVNQKIFRITMPAAFIRSGK